MELRHRLKTVFGLTPQQWQAMYDAQDGKCPICGLPSEQSPKGKLGVDHDHATGKVRELLCGHCNAGLGRFRDSPNLLARAISYLNKHAAPEADVEAGYGY